MHRDLSNGEEREKLMEIIWAPQQKKTRRKNKLNHICCTDYFILFIRHN